MNWEPGEFKHFKNVLNDLTVKRILRDFQKPSLRTNLTHWDPKIVSTSGVIMLYDLPEDLRFEIKEQVEKLLPEDAKDMLWSMTYTVGSRLSYLSWHNDSHHEYSVTIYLNEHWDREFHGFFVHESPDGLRAVLPEYNTALAFKPPMQHCTVMPTIQAPLRHSLQIFVVGRDQQVKGY